MPGKGRYGMKSVVITAPGFVEIREVSMPVRRKGETLLRVLVGGICGSDLASYRGENGYISYPRTIGHEFAAEVVESDSSDLMPGMLVTCNPYFNCGKCYSCRRGLVHCCVNNQTMGVQREGAFADYITMPTQRVYDGSGISPEILALIEPFCISHHGVCQAEIQAGEKVLIMGGGAIGIFAALTAKLQRAQVYLSDIEDEKLDFIGKNFPIDGIIHNIGEEAMAEAVGRITNGDGFDVTVEAAGAAQSFLSCVEASASRARMIQIGVSKKTVDFNFSLLQKKELRIFGSRAATKADFVQTMNYVRNGWVDLKSLISRCYKAEDAIAAFVDLDENAGSIIKMELEF